MFGPLPEDWKRAIGPHGCLKLEEIEASLRKRQPFYPPPEKVLRAFRETKFHSVRVVILGHDPYFGPKQADGLAFSVGDGIPHPPSLRRIFKEVERNCGTRVPTRGSGDLGRWTKQDVLLLNTSLTVAPGAPGSHDSLGWDSFTDRCLRALSQKRKKLVFMLWGKRARERRQLIDECRHRVLDASHPVAGRCVGQRFKNCRHFAKANSYLGKKEIRW